MNKKLLKEILNEARGKKVYVEVIQDNSEFCTCSVILESIGSTKNESQLGEYMYRHTVEVDMEDLLEALLTGDRIYIEKNIGYFSE